MNVALYARVSTADQDCSMQIDELRRYKARGWDVSREYIDTISGAKSSRPQRNQLMEDAMSRRIDVVIVWKLNRWGRSLADSVVTLERLSSAGVRFICTTQGLDTDNANPVGRAMLGMLQVFAQFERDLINERVNLGIKRYQSEFRAGRAVSKSGKNLPIGRPKSIFRVDEARQLRQEGLSWRKIAKRVGVSEATLRARCEETCHLKPEKRCGEQGTNF